MPLCPMGRRDLMTSRDRSATAGSRQTHRSGLPAKIQRFVASERFVHWALAIPFVLLYASALAMLVFWGEPQPRYIRTASSWVHKVSGIGLIVLPPLALLWGRREWRVHRSNIREAWTWTRNDFRWLLLSPLAAVNPRIQLPDQGKFNAAEKLNFMMVCTTYPLYIITGILIWLPGAAFVSWLLHVAMAALGLVLVAGHIFMATINPSTRTGLQGMITGWVDREWAKHHYRRWYRERFERTVAPSLPRLAPSSLKHPAKIRCGSCGEVHTFESWERLLQRLFQVEPLFCWKCKDEVVPALGGSAPGLARAVLQHLEHSSADEPLEKAAVVA